MHLVEEFDFIGFLNGTQQRIPLEIIETADGLFTGLDAEFDVDLSHYICGCFSAVIFVF